MHTTTVAATVADHIALTKIAPFTQCQLNSMLTVMFPRSPNHNSARYHSECNSLVRPLSILHFYKYVTQPSLVGWSVSVEIILNINNST